MTILSTTATNYEWFPGGNGENPKLISSRRGVAEHQRELIIIDSEDSLF